MALTNSQVESFRQVGDALQQRGIALLTGSSNGKTTILHSALEVLGQRDERTGFYSSNPRHAEDRTIDFFRIYLMSYSTLPNIMRQILTFAKFRDAKGKQTPGRSAADVVMNFDVFMRQMAKEGRMLCLAVDNAELLSAKGYTLLKAMNEYHDPMNRRSIGAGILLAGEITKLKKMPASFLIRSTEVMVGKIGHAEVKQLIESLYPGSAHWFEEAAVQRLMKCHTTLQMKSAIDRSLADRTRYRLTSIAPDLIEEKLADLPVDRGQSKIAEKKYALAA